MSREIPPYPESHDLLAGKGVVVTAAAGTGIGFATAKRCAEEGARVVISDHHERRLGEAADTIAAAVGERPHTIVCDVTDDDAVRALVDGSAEALGGIDVMVNNAGLGGEVDLVDMTDDQWDLVLDVTLNGTFRTTGAVASSSTTPRSSAGGRSGARPTTPRPRPGSWPSPVALPSKRPTPASGSTPSPPAWPPTRS